MNNLIKEIIAPQYSVEEYKKIYMICDKIIQIGIFAIVMIQLIFSYVDYKDGNLLIASIYIILSFVSLVYINKLIRMCRCNLQEEIPSQSYSEKNNRYIFEILTRISENARNIFICFIIVMYSERMIVFNIWVVAIIFIIASIPTVINIGKKIFANIVVLSIIFFDFYSIYVLVDIFLDWF